MVEVLGAAVKVKRDGQDAVLTHFKLKDLEALWVVALIEGGKISYLMGELKMPKMFLQKTEADAWVSEMVLLEQQVNVKNLTVVPLSMVREGSMWANYK